MKMEKQSLFVREEQVIGEARNLLASSGLPDKSCTAHYEKLLRHYERMFDQMKRIVRISDKFEEALRASLEEKEVLLREVHHRVKNNLAAIISMLNLQRQATGGTATAAILADLGDRIKSMALVHEKLYRSDQLSRIDSQDYFEALSSHLIKSIAPCGHVRCRVAAKGVEMNLDTAIPCGMIVNELITNALKHAFPEGRTGTGEGFCEINVSMEHDGTAYMLAVFDNGVGIPPEVDWTTGKTLGLRLVKMLGQHQLGGRIELDRNGGTRFVLYFSSGQRS